MSARRRGRKGKDPTTKPAGKTSRGRSLFAVPKQPTPEPGPECDCPVCRGEQVDPDQLVDVLLGEAADLCAGSDPLDAEVAGAVLISTVTLAISRLGRVGTGGVGTGGVDAGGVDAGAARDEVLLDGLIPAFEARASTEAMAMLLALGAVGPDPVAAAASRAVDRLARAGVSGPAWAGELGAPVTVGRCWRLRDPAGAGAILGASFVRSGRSHAIVVGVDADDCGAATEIALLGADELPAALAVMRSAPPDRGVPGGDGGTVIEETLDAPQWRWQTEVALDARDVHDQEDIAEFGLDGLDGLDLEGFDGVLGLDEFDDVTGVGEFDTDESEDEQDAVAGYPVMAVLLRARLATMPRSSVPKPAHGGHGEGLTLDLALLAETLQELVPSGRGGPRRGAGQPARLAAKRRKRDRPAPIYQVKVGICHAKPPIWRRLELPADTSLAGLHEIIQVAFDWNDNHMHVFHTPYGEFGVADAGLGYRAEAPVTVEQVAPSRGDKIGYTYDFGDDWNLQIVVENVHATDFTTDLTGYPRCTGGRRAAPPEGSGGIKAYTYLIAALADSDHPAHGNAIDWLGYTNPHPYFDPAQFDTQILNNALSRLR